MSNVSGVEDNRVFRATFVKGQEYHYIETQVKLDLSVANSSVVMKYCTTSDGNYVIVDDHSVIGEVTVYPGNDFESGVLDYTVGGIYSPESVVLPLLEAWGGPTGNVPGPINASELAVSQICRFGKEISDPDKKYLAISVANTSGSDQDVKGTLHVVIKVYPKFI